VVARSRFQEIALQRERIVAYLHVDLRYAPGRGREAMVERKKTGVSHAHAHAHAHSHAHSHSQKLEDILGDGGWEKTIGEAEMGK